MRSFLGQASRQLSQRYISVTIFLLWSEESRQQMEFKALNMG